MATSPRPSEETQSTINTTGICQVCGDGASIVNYGALTCSSCRTFFRRNGYSTKEGRSCRYNNHCDVTKLTRKRCAACRLTKCLTVGMRPDLIRKEDLRGTGRKLVESQPIMTIPQVPALDLPIDSSSLNSTEWSLIANVVHAFDTFSPISDIRRAIEGINTLTFDLSQSLRMISSFSNSLQLFISSTPDFKVLTTSEQWSLLRRNIFGLLSIGGIYFMRESGIFDKPENELVVLPLYGNEVIGQVKTLSTQLDHDPVLIKLILLAVAFSTNCFIKQSGENANKDSLLLGTFRLFGSQNVYVDLLWKYLTHRYNYDEAVQRFSILMKRFLDILTLSIEIYENNQIFQTFIDNIIEQVQQSPMINEKIIVPLWGKS